MAVAKLNPKILGAAKTSIRTYRAPPAPPAASGPPEQRLARLEEWARNMEVWATQSQTALVDFINRSGLG